MRSTARLLTIFCVILTAISIFAAVMVSLAIQTMALSFGQMFAIIIFTFGTSIVSLLLTISLRSLCRDLDLEYETTATRIHDLKKRITELEEKCK